jgi:hypothetical protein
VSDKPDRCGDCELEIGGECLCIRGKPDWLSGQRCCVEWRSLKYGFRGVEDYMPHAEAVAAVERLNRLYDGKVKHFITVRQPERAAP